MANLLERNWVKWMAGVVAPIFAAVFDPCLFKGGISEEPEFLGMRPIAYAMIFGGSLAMSLRLLTRRGGSFAAGMLTSFCILSLCLGVCLLPLSLVGMVIAGIGVFGLLPFATAIVFCMEASLCFARHKSWPRAVAGFCLVILCLVGFHIASTTAMRRALEDMKTNPKVSRTTRMTAWATIPIGFKIHCMLQCGRLDPGPERERLAAAYSEILGGDLESEVWSQMD